jgi:hypothetical protein
MKKPLLNFFAPILAIPYAIGIFAAAFTIFTYALICIVADKSTNLSINKMSIARKYSPVMPFTGQALTPSELSA